MVQSYAKALVGSRIFACSAAADKVLLTKLLGYEIKME